MSKQSERKKREARAKAKTRSQLVPDNLVSQTSNQNPENQSGTNAQNHQDKDGLSAETVVFGALNVVGGLVFAHFSQASFSTGHIIVGLWCSCGGILMACLLLSLIAAQVWRDKKPLIVKGCTAVSVLIVTGFGTWHFNVNRVSPNVKVKPSFVVSLSISDESAFFVPLTNEFLVMKNGSNFVEGALFVPKRDLKSDMWLQFHVHNNSEVIADLPIELSVWLPKGFKAAPTSEWTHLESTSFFPSVFNKDGTEAFLYEFRSALLRHRSTYSSAIKITSSSFIEGPIGVRIVSRDSPPLHMAFETLLLPVKTNAFIYKPSSKDDPWPAGIPRRF